MNIIGKVRGKKIKPKKTFETNLIKLISILLIILFLSIIALYYSSIRSMYSEQLEKSNESIIEQVTISFETIIKQITDGIYKIPLYDTEMIRLIKFNSRDVSYQIELQKKMDNIVFSNSYLYSAYLYIPAQDVVYSSQSGNSYPLYDFKDKDAIVSNSNGAISILDPRMVELQNGKILLMSVVCPIPLYQGEYEGLLIVNIDASRLYYDILKMIKADDNMNFYVYNKDNTVIINKDTSLLFKEFRPSDIEKAQKNFFVNLKNFIIPYKVLDSAYYSAALKWNFRLETAVRSPSPLFTKLYSIGISLMVLLLISLIVVSWIIKSSARPVKKVLSSYNEKLWIDFITGNGVDTDELYKQLELDTNHFIYDAYAVLVLQLVKSDISQVEFLKYLDGIKAFVQTMGRSYDLNILVIHKNQIAILLNFEQNSIMENDEYLIKEFALPIYSSLDVNLRSIAYMSISTPKVSAYKLPSSYRECLEALNYKIIYGDTHILQYSLIKGANPRANYEYPYDLEKQLNNNLVVGNPEACKIFIEKFFEKLADSVFNLSDSEIKNFIYQLQTSILKTVSSLPVTVKIGDSTSILDLYNLDEIKIRVSGFIMEIASEINKAGQDEENTLLNNIFNFIERKFMDEDFNLNSVSDVLSMNRNYLTKIVKEKTGYNFNEYITKKRISMAKVLLQDKNKPIESIAHKVGFNYAHYFIKVFKSQEGITPGQYRERLVESNVTE